MSNLTQGVDVSGVSTEVDELWKCLLQYDAQLQMVKLPARCLPFQAMPCIDIVRH